MLLLTEPCTMQEEALEMHRNERFLARLWHAPRMELNVPKLRRRAIENGTPDSGIEFPRAGEKISPVDS